jgi:hypothetical protein
VAHQSFLVSCILWCDCEFARLSYKHLCDIEGLDCEDNLDITTICVNGKLARQNERLCNLGVFRLRNLSKSEYLNINTWMQKENLSGTIASSSRQPISEGATYPSLEPQGKRLSNKQIHNVRRRRSPTAAFSFLSLSSKLNSLPSLIRLTQTLSLSSLNPHSHFQS